MISVLEQITIESRLHCIIELRLLCCSTILQAGTGFRKVNGDYLREGQWKDLAVKMYII